MMSVLNTTYSAAKECLKHGIPFALCLKPGLSVDSLPEFFVENIHQSKGYSELSPTELESFDGFVISPFQVSDTHKVFGIRAELSAEQILDFVNRNESYQLYENSYLQNSSTDKDVHLKNVALIANNLHSDSEKTVLSRILVKESTIDPVDAAFKYFNQHQTCFRYIVSLPNYGVWFGATPELLLEYDRNDYELATMSLAGTRSIFIEGQWDAKNVLEHNIVTDFICQNLSNYGLSVDEPILTIVKFNEIEHLCHMVYAHGYAKIAQLLPGLSPTPAVCGWPRESAYNQIIELENHKRHFYGGYVGTTNPDFTHLFVNLRCAYSELYSNNKTIYTLYAGGGITCHSNPEIEWIETEQKMKSLLAILKK